MASTNNIDHMELLYAAINSELGVVVETDDAEFLRQKLYAIRREYAEFQNLSLVISPLNGVDLWIVKKGENNAEET